MTEDMDLMKVLISMLRSCELYTLFFCAYLQAQQGAPETEYMACVMLANQFAASLKHKINVKVASWCRRKL